MIEKLVVFFAILAVCLSAVDGFALTLEWDRNVEDDMDHYEVFACSTSATCIPGTTVADKLTADVNQPDIGVVPSVVIPAGRSGRAGVIAVDLIGNRSSLSNIVSFTDATPPGAPANVRTR